MFESIHLRNFSLHPRTQKNHGNETFLSISSINNLFLRGKNFRISHFQQFSITMCMRYSLISKFIFLWFEKLCIQIVGVQSATRDIKLFWSLENLICLWCSIFSSWLKSYFIWNANRNFPSCSMYYISRTRVQMNYIRTRSL